MGDEQTVTVTALAGSEFYQTTLLPQVSSHCQSVMVPIESPPLFKLGDLLMSPSSDDLL